MSACRCLLFQPFSPWLRGPAQFWPGSWKQMSIKYLRLKCYGWELIHGKCVRWNICHSHKWPTVTQDFAMTKLAILTWRYLYLLNWVIANLSFDQNCCPFSGHTNVTHGLQLLSLVQHHSACNAYAKLDCTPRSDSLFISVVTARHTHLFKIDRTS